MGSTNGKDLLNNAPSFSDVISNPIVRGVEGICPDCGTRLKMTLRDHDLTRAKFHQREAEYWQEQNKESRRREALRYNKNIERLEEKNRALHQKLTHANKANAKLIREMGMIRGASDTLAIAEENKMLKEQLHRVSLIINAALGRSAEILPLYEDYQLREMPIENLDLSVRVFNSLKRQQIQTIGEVVDLFDKGDDALLALRNFGEKSLEELVDALRSKGIHVTT